MLWLLEAKNRDADSIHCPDSIAVALHLFFLYGWHYLNSIFQFETQMINGDKIVETQ